MSEYWISQGRRMCTYCKCWTADNKASINFHEQGKNHKENVKKKLDELRKKGLADAKSKQNEQSDMEKIERAALASLKKDMLSNPNMAGVYGISEDKINAVQKAAASPASRSKGATTTATSKEARQPSSIKKQSFSRHNAPADQTSASSASSVNATIHYQVSRRL